MDDHLAHTTPNLRPLKMDVLPKTYLQIILATKWLVRNSGNDLCLLFCLIFFSDLQPTDGFRGFYYFLQYYSVICRPSDHTVGSPRPRFEPGTGDLEAGTLTTRPPHPPSSSSMQYTHNPSLYMVCTMALKEQI